MTAARTRSRPTILHPPNTHEQSATPRPPHPPQVPLNEYEFPSSKLANVQSQLERLVEKNYYLHQGARDAYR